MMGGGGTKKKNHQQYVQPSRFLWHIKLYYVALKYL